MAISAKEICSDFTQGALISVPCPVIAIVGPTASGKSDVAQYVAELISVSENEPIVISADSMQIYRGMDIGTGKLSPEEMRVKHCGIDICDPGEPYSAALFQAYARDIILDAQDNDRRCLLVGGTGLYVRAVIDDYRFPSGEQVHNPVREKWQTYADQFGATCLWEKLREKDPASAKLIHPNNVKRVIRAFEMLEGEGTTYATQHAGFAEMKQYLPAYIFHLDVDTPLLYERINNRVDKMFRDGLVEEVQSLIDKGFSCAVTAGDAIGYKEVVAALRGSCTMDQAKEDIKQASRRYSKRQRSWWKNDQRVIHVNANEGNPLHIARDIVERVRLLELDN